jgi:hypothetical protein
MFRARRDLSHGGVFHFVTGASTEKRGLGYECAGKASGSAAAACARAGRREPL